MVNLLYFEEYESNLSHALLKREDINVEFGINKVENANPDVFEEGKGMGRYRSGKCD